ncbi:MAG: (Fe-S)-binding protein [Candidatus Thorarchaeota archaeon]|jgi:Fe-S oxidoreductase
MDPDTIAEQVRMCAACPKMCRHVCPTFFAWRSDAPTPHGRALILHQEITGTNELDERGIEVLYQCLECSHCLTWCKPEIDIATLVEFKRQELVKQNLLPRGLKKLSKSIRKQYNPFDEPHEERNSWINPDKKEGRRVLYFVGCLASYREKEIVEDTVASLELLGHQVVIEEDEHCCGSPLFRTGNEEEGVTQARHNVDLLNAVDSEEIVASCPGCYRVLTQDYPKYGLELNKQVRHISEVLAESVDKLPSASFDGIVTFHDACHLGRHCGIYDPPREVIAKVSGKVVVEMERNRENASCCGNGAGLRTLFPDQAKKIGTERIRHATNVDAKYLVTTCPFCKNMLASQSDESITVLDLPELVMLAKSSRDVKKD